jgi:hypothetical protein
LIRCAERRFNEHPKTTERENAVSEATLTTTRTVLGTVIICMGCCCGRTDRGHPEVPVDWLKSEWKSRKLLRSVHLSISGCLGPCDVSNVCSIIAPGETMWLGGLSARAHYEALLDWAISSKDAGRLLPLPSALHGRRFNPTVPAPDAAESDALMGREGRADATAGATTRL